MLMHEKPCLTKSKKDLFHLQAKFSKSLFSVNSVFFTFYVHLQKKTNKQTKKKKKKKKKTIANY